MIYFFDGTKEAFLTAFLLAYRDEDALITTGSRQLLLGQESVFVRADREKARRCAARLTQYDPHCMRDLSLLLRSCDETRGQTAFRYLRLVAARRRPVRGELAEQAVADATDCIRRVTLEVHRLKGFLRFMECASGALYAPLSPDHDVCDLLLPHFRARLGQLSFVIHDVQRGKAAVWDGSHAFCAPLERAEVALSADEDAWQALWKQYYADINIPSRTRPGQMRGYMPVRYWKFMPEAPAQAAEDAIARCASPSEWQDDAPRPQGSAR